MNKQISAEEMKNIASIVTGDKAAVDKAFAEGLHIAGERFVLTKNDEGSLYARKVRRDCTILDGHTCCLVATNYLTQLFTRVARVLLSPSRSRPS